MQDLPPPTLVKTWLEVVKQQGIPTNIRDKRSKLLNYYFGSIADANRYVEEHDSYNLVTS